MQTANPNRTRNVRLGSLLAGCISLLSSPALTRLAAQTPPLQVAQQAYLKTSITGANDYFGYAVAVSGDTVVVGAYGESSSSKGVNGDQTDNSAPGSGAAYVFVLSGTNWVQQAYLKASNAEAGDGFGYSVAVSGDTVVVGSPQEDSKARGVNGD